MQAKAGYWSCWCEIKANECTCSQNTPGGKIIRVLFLFACVGCASLFAPGIQPSLGSESCTDYCAVNCGPYIGFSRVDTDHRFGKNSKICWSYLWSRLNCSFIMFHVENSSVFPFYPKESISRGNWIKKKKDDTHFCRKYIKGIIPIHRYKYKKVKKSIYPNIHPDRPSPINKL